MRRVAVDLFCGIGGLTKGLSMAGIDVVAGYDIDGTCRFPYETNNGGSFIEKNVEDISKEEINRWLPADAVRMIVGCAPCQPFSRYSLRYRKDGHKDNKWKLLYSFARIVRECQPDIVSMENVPSLEKEEVFIDFVTELEKHDYFVEWRVVYCPEYGVPQKRKRLVLLASRFGQIRMIEPLYVPEEYRTVRMAIGDLPAIRDGEICPTDNMHRASRLSPLNLRRIQQSVPGGTWRDWDKELQLECHGKKSGKTYGSVYGRMCWDEPSPTITTQFYGYGNGRFGHPEQDRAISLREGALLQSFPENYVFTDENHQLHKREVGVHVGNAVPVELGHAIGISIQRHLDEFIGEE